MLFRAFRAFSVNILPEHKFGQTLKVAKHWLLRKHFCPCLLIWKHSSHVALYLKCALSYVDALF